MEEEIFLRSYITCIKLVTLELVNYTLLVYSGRFFVSTCTSWILWLTKTDWTTVWIFWLSSLLFLRTKSAEAWSLNSRTHYTNWRALCGGRFRWLVFCLWSNKIPDGTNDKTLRIFKQNNRSHSTEKYDQQDDKRYARSSMVFNSPRL